MKTKKRQKLCYHCEGEVDLDVIVCPFCAADLRVEKPEQRTSYNASESLKNLSTQQSLYPPNYVPKEEPEPQEEEPLVQTEEAEKSIFTPLFLLSFGSQLLLLGLLMLLFAKNGKLHLQWDARFWFFYLFVSIPMLAFGYRALK